MEYRILGPLEVVDDGRSLALGGSKPRALLAVLLLNAGHVVTHDRLIDSLWGDRAPADARHALQVYVSQLRKALGAEGTNPIATHAAGYRIDARPEDIDVQRFERAVASARSAMSSGDPARAAELLDDALDLFRGEPLIDLAHEPFAVAAITRIDELRLTAIEERVRAELDLGRHGELIPELQELVAAHPLREGLRAHLMLALYRSGRQAEALACYREGRSVLSDELGIDPMPDLQALHDAILRQEPTLGGVNPQGPVAAPARIERSAVEAPGGSRGIERKFATALFADLVGSTSLAEREDPEVVRSLIRRTFERLVDEIERYGGITEKFVGDAVLAVFGVPAAHEDDPERAIRAALGMQASVVELSRDLAAEGRMELSVRVGIEAGEVLVELDRVTRSRDQMLTGDAVNTAARLQAAAEPGQVVVGPAAHAAAAATIEFRELPPFSLKGKAEPVPAWEAVAAHARVGGERPPTGLRARMVGRDEELAMLVQTYQRVESEGRPTLVTILGPAGVGKSRLAFELSRALGSRTVPPSWRKGRCLAYGNVPYSALADTVKAECGIQDDDLPEAVSAKVTSAVERLLGDPGPTASIETLVGGRAADRISREDLFDAWRRFVQRMADERPLVLQLEDLHWADQGLLDFVEHLADWAEGPVLVLTLARPELLDLRPTWGGGRRSYTAVSLDPLAPAETGAMLDDLLPTRLPPDVSRLLIERSEGYPLFTEEVVRMLIDRRLLRSDETGAWAFEGSADEIEVPRSIQALIATRIDSLPADEKAVLQDAAVVGRTFWLGAVERLGATDRRATKDALGRLRVKEILIDREGATFSGETEYLFRHVLIRDVAYDSVPKATRAAKHVEVAAWAKERAGERRDEIAGLLATHLVEALRYRSELGEPHDGDLVREALRWSRTAGARSLAVWEQREAASWFRGAADLAERAGEPREALASDLESYARAAEAVDSYTVVAGASQRALELYLEAGWEDAAGRLEAWLAHVAFQSGDEEGVVGWAQRALARLEPLGDSRDLALALVYLGWYHHRFGRDDVAEPYLARAMAMAEHVDDPVVRGEAMLALGMLTYKSGRTDEGMSLLRSALELARSTGDLSFLLRALLVVSEGLELVAGDYEGAADLVREGLQLAREAGHVEQIAWMQGNLADYLADMGRLDEAEASAREGLEAARMTNEVPRLGYSLLMLAWLLTLKGGLDEAELLLAEARPVTDQMTETYHEGWATLIAAFIARARGREGEALDLLLDGARRSSGRLEAWAGQLLLAETVRLLVRADRASEIPPIRDELARLAMTSAGAAVFLRWADALAEPDPSRSRAALAEAADRLASLRRAVDHGRCLVDLAEREHELGQDPTATFARARDVLESCGATLLLQELAALEASGRESAPG